MCCSVVSLKMMRILLDKYKIPYSVELGAPSADPVSRLSSTLGPRVVAFVDTFSELPEEIQSYLLTTTGGLLTASGGLDGAISRDDASRGLVLGGTAGAPTQAKAPAGRRRQTRSS